MPHISQNSTKSTPLNTINKKSSSEENLVTKNKSSLIEPRTKTPFISPDLLAKANEISNVIKSGMNTEYLLPSQFIKFPVNQEKAILTDIYTLPPYEDNRNHSAPLSIINLDKNNTSPKDIKWDNTPMEISNSSKQTVNIKNSHFLIKDFGINKLKHFFYESIEKVKSTGKIQALVIVNKIIPREKDLYNVKFYNKEGTVEIQKTHKENVVMLNDVKNPPISFTGKEKDKFNKIKDLQSVIHTLEKDILKIKKTNPENIGNLQSEFNYTKSFKYLIDQCILSPSDQRDKKFDATIETMNRVVNELKNERDNFKGNQNSSINITVENNIYKSNVSLSSNSSSYFSEITEESEYSSEEITKMHIENDHITTQKNNELKNKKAENTEAPQKKTHSVVNSKKKTYQSNGKIYINRATILRDKHISKTFNLNENPQKKILNDGKLNTKELDTSFEKIQKTLHDINVLGEQIVNEKAHSAMLKTELAKLK